MNLNKPPYLPHPRFPTFPLKKTTFTPEAFAKPSKSTGHLVEIQNAMEQQIHLVSWKVGCLFFPCDKHGDN